MAVQIRKARHQWRSVIARRAINGARLVLFDGMGHDLPRELWDDIVGELKTNFAQTG